MESRKVIERDLAGQMLVQGHMDSMRAELIHASRDGVREVDIVLRQVCIVGETFPEIVVDYGGELLQTLAKAIKIIGAADAAKPMAVITDIAPNRVGTTTEYKRGEFYLSHTVWEDGHEEVEIHRCAPKQLFHSFDDLEKHLPAPEQALHTCDKNQFADVFSKFALLPAGPAELSPAEPSISVHAQDHIETPEE